MRRLVSFSCAADHLAATLDDAAGTTGLLIISGGNEIRAGAHRGMAKLAADICAAGFPVFRFDRRGIGDSEGDNGGFLSSADDIDAAAHAFRAQCPILERIVVFGNCDAASAILIHRPEAVSAALLANIWTIEATEETGPPPAAIKARYKEKLMQPREWFRLLSGGINLRKLAKGLLRAAAHEPVTPLSLSIAGGIAAFDGSIDMILAKRDATAIAFMDEWQKPHFQKTRTRNDVNITMIDSGSHSFSSASDYQALLSSTLNLLRRTQGHQV